MKHSLVPILVSALFAACHCMKHADSKPAQGSAAVAATAVSAETTGTSDSTAPDATSKGGASSVPMVAMAGAGASAATSFKVFPYEVQRATLDNGLSVLMIPMPSDGLVSYWSIVRTGSRDEVEEGVTGFAHFFEHMMFRGTEKLPGKAYDRIVNGMGADANAYTTDDRTCYHLSFATASLPKVIEIEADRFQNLKYEEAEFKTESGAVYGEYRKGRSSPFEVLDEVVRNVAFDKHTYKHTTIGFEADIKAMPTRYEYSKTFFQRFYRPENVVILVTGDFDPTTTLDLIRKEYGGWKKGYEAPKITAEPPQTKQRRVDIPFDGQTLPLVVLNFKGPAFAPADRTTMAAMLVGELAFGSTSPLYKQLVLDEQKVEMLGGNLDPNRDPGLWSVYAMVKEPADVPMVEAALWKAIQGLRTTPVPADRLDAVRSNMRYGFLSNLATPADVSEQIARYVALTGDVTCVDTMFATLATVTPEDVRKAADTWLRAENCTVGILHTKGQEIPSVSSLPPSDASPTGRPLDATSPAPIGTRASIADATAPTLEFAPQASDAKAAPTSVVSQTPVLMPVAQDPTVSFRLWFQVGSQDDPVGKEGLAALTGSMISDGATKKNAYDKILARLFPMAASYSVSVDKEMTFVNGQVHRDNVEPYYELLIQAITEPAFETSDFERLRDQMISGIENNLRFASGEELGKATLTSRVFQGTRYAHIADGTVASLKKLTLDDVKAFHRTYYTRDNVVVGLGGAYPSDLPVRIQSDLGVLPAGKPARVPKPALTPIRGRHVVLVDNPSAIGSSISMGVPIDLHRGSKEFYALWIANSWLGEHRNSASHLYQVIREERGVNYGNYSYIEAFPGGGGRRMPPQGVGRRQQMFEIWLRTLPTENTLFAVRTALHEVENLVKNGMTKDQFEFTKGFLKGYSSHFAESTFERLGYALDDRFYGTSGHLATFKQMMNELTLADVNAAVKKYMKTDDLVIAIVTNDATGLKAAFSSAKASTITYAPGAEKSPEILAQDKVFGSHPLSVSAANVTIVPVAEMFEGGPVRSSRN